MKSGSSTWVVGSALLALLLAAGAWLLLYSPTLARGAEANTARAEAEKQNQELREQVTVLAADHARLPEMQAELAALRTQFPTAVELPEFTRGLANLVEATGAQVTTVTVSASQAVSTVPELPGAPDGTPPPVFPEVPGGLYAVPISMSVKGTFEQAQQFAAALQGEHQRLFLLSRLSWTSADQDAEETFSINGHTYVLTSGAAPETGE